MSEHAAAIAKLQELHPRPRIGQRLKLRKGGKIVEVIGVRNARAILRLKNEVEALLMGPRLQAAFGSYWIEVYYEADVVVGDSAMITVNTMDVEAVLDSD